MTVPNSDVKEIIDSPDLGVTELRQYSKETLISVIREMKKNYTSETIRVKEKEIELALINGKIELAKTGEFTQLADRILNLSTQFIDHPYGPNGFGNMVQGISGILGSTGKGSSAVVDPVSEIEDLAILEDRVKVAREQGMKWNSRDVRPERKSTVLKKVEEWESALVKGRSVNVESILNTEYGDLLKSGGGCESYVIGICETMERYLGIGQASKYLKSRFKRDVARYMKVKGLKSVPVEPENTEPEYDLDELGGKLVTRFLGDGVEKSNFNRRVDVFKKYVEAVDMRWEDVSGVDILMRMVNGHMPIGIPLTKSSDNPTIPEVFQQIVIRKIYNDELEKFWKDFCRDEGLIAA